MKLCRHCKINEGTIVDSKPICNGVQYFYYTCRSCLAKRGRDYRKTIKGKIVYREMMRRQIINNSQKIRARQLVYRRLKSGELVRPNKCNRCNALCKPQAHHEDYNNPLIVIWLCVKCHRMV